MEAIRESLEQVVQRVVAQTEPRNLSMASAVVVSGTLILSLAWVFGRKPKQEFGEDGIRTVPGNWFLGNMLEIMKLGSPGFAKKYMNDTDSDAIRFKFMGDAVLLKGPYLIDQCIAYEAQGKIQVRWMGFFLKLFSEYSILAVNDKKHAAQRRAVMAVMTPTHLNNYFPQAVDAFDGLVSRWLKLSNNGTEYLDSFDEMSVFASILNGRFFLGDHISDEDLIEINSYFPAWKAGFAALPVDLPFTTYGKALQAAEKLRDVVCREVDYRAVHGHPEREDLLKNCIESLNPETDKPYSREEFRGQIATLLFGALDTTVATEMYLTVLASEQKEAFDKAMKKLREELLAVFKSTGKSSLRELTYSELVSIPYVTAVVDEIIRLAAPAPNASRMCVEDITLRTKDGREFNVSAGSNIWVSLVATITTNPHITNPDVFDPERFIEPRNEGKSPANGLPPFGYGKRLCPGMKFAVLQIAIMASLCALRGVRFTAREKAELVYTPALLAPKGVWVSAYTV